LLESPLSLASAAGLLLLVVGVLLPTPSLRGFLTVCGFGLTGNGPGCFVFDGDSGDLATGSTAAFSYICSSGLTAAGSTAAGS